MLLLRSLDRGGAERQAVTLACALKTRGWPVTVALLYGSGPLVTGLDDTGVPIFDLGKRGRWDVVVFLFRLWRLLRVERPNILHGYLPVPNLLAVLMRLFFPKMRVVWGVRTSNMDLSHYDWLMRLSFWLERRCSSYVDLIVANSKSGAQLRIAQGFPKVTLQVIPNGIDTERFRFDPEGRERLRHEWNVPAGAVVVGIVGRFDPMKDYPTFLQAAAQLATKYKHWHFVCVGAGPVNYREVLIKLADELGLGKRVTWTGSRDDMAAVYSALDIAAASSSFGEGFSNVIAEAMACGRPCVVTDVGDSAAIVGELGVVVSPRDPLALAAGIELLRARLDKEGDALRGSVSMRIEQEFSMEDLAERTASTLQELFKMS